MNSYKKLLKKIFKNNEPIYVDYTAPIGIKGTVHKAYKGDGTKNKPFVSMDEAIKKANETGQDIYQK